GLHRLPHGAPGYAGRVLAAGCGTGRGRRPRGGGVLVRGAGPTGRSDMSSPARRARHGRDLSLAPVFLTGRRPGPVPGRRGVPADMYIDLTAEQRALRDELQ